MPASYDVVGYMFNADLFCPRHIVDALPTGPGGAYEGWALAPGADPLDTEANLDEIAAAFGIDREDERSFDSGDFPKVVFRDQVRTQADGDFEDHGPDRCATCHEVLGD